MMNNRNASGAADPTAAEAMKNMQHADVTRRAEYTIRILKRYLKSHGFELIGRIPLRHMRSGREFR